MGEKEITKHTLFCVHIVSTKSKAKSCKSSPENGSSPDTTKSILSHYLTLFIILILSRQLFVCDERLTVQMSFIKVFETMLMFSTSANDLVA